AGPAAGAIADSVPWKEILGFAPHALWAVVLVAILLWLGRDRIRTVLGRVRKVSVAGVEIELGEEIRAAAPARRQGVRDPECGRLDRRLARCEEVIAGARILWVDDAPALHEPESEILDKLGAIIVMAESTAAAGVELRRQRFDLILSDIGRDDPTDDALAI